MKHLLRTKFKNEIVTEFLPPQRKSDKVVIFCGGLPTSPSKRTLLNFFARKNYWVFEPRYRGTWESEGKFLARSSEQDVYDIIDSLKYGFTSLWDGKKYKVDAKSIYICGSSFGGALALMASRHRKVVKAVVLSPVVDWRAEYQTAKTPTWLGSLLQQGYGGAYRFSLRDWKKLERGKFLNPVDVLGSLDKNKIYIIHAKDDRVVSLSAVKKFSKRLDCKFTLLSRGGHFSLSVLSTPSFYKRIKKFFDEPL